jgi:hypothetical protein
MQVNTGAHVNQKWIEYWYGNPDAPPCDQGKPQDGHQCDQCESKCSSQVPEPQVDGPA